MKQLKLAQIVFFMSLSTSTHLLAMDESRVKEILTLKDFAPEQQAELKKLSKGLYQAFKGNALDTSGIDKILGHEASLPDSYRMVLVEMRDKSGKTPLQKMYLKYSERHCTNRPYCKTHIRTRPICSKHFMRLLEYGADLRQITATQLIPCWEKLIDTAIATKNINVATAIFSHSAELTNAMFAVNGGEKLVEKVLKANFIGLIDLVFAQPGITKILVDKLAPQANAEVAAHVQAWLKEKGYSNYCGILADFIIKKSPSQLASKLASIIDATERGSEATAAMSRALLVWKEAFSASDDIAAIRMIATLIKAGGSLSALSRDQLAIKNNFRDHNLLHSAAHVGGEVGDVIAHALMAHSDELASSLLGGKTSQSKTPMQVAINFQHRSVVEILKKRIKAGDDGNATEDFSVVSLVQ